MSLEVRPATERAVTRGEGRITRHSFAFGAHYDPDNVGFGALVAHNDDHLDAHAGYAAHRHSGLQIVTWMLSGTLRHRHIVDGRAESSEVGPGQVQVLGTGSGVEHAEFAGDEPVHLVQSWLPDDNGAAVAYRRAEPELQVGELTAVVGPGSAIDWTLPVGLSVGVLELGRDVRIPPAEWAHVFLAEGAVRLDGHQLAAGDVVRLSGQGGDMSTEQDAMVLVWSSR